MELEGNPNITIDVTIEDAPPPEGDTDTLSQRCVFMATVVDEVIAGFEKTFD